MGSVAEPRVKGGPPSSERVSYVLGCIFSSCVDRFVKLYSNTC